MPTLAINRFILPLGLLAASGCATLSPSGAPQTEAHSPSKKKTHVVDVHAYDGFNDSKALSTLWQIPEGSRAQAFESQSRIRRDGAGSLQISVNADESAEIEETTNLESIEEQTDQQSFSFLLPADFPQSQNVILARWNQRCSTHCSKTDPVLALQISGDLLQITRADDHDTQILWEQKGLPRDQWLDFRFRVRFTPKKTGSIEVWKYRQSIVKYSGPTAYGAASGYVSGSRFAFRMGLLRGEKGDALTAYFDEYRKDRVAPTK